MILYILFFNILYQIVIQASQPFTRDFSSEDLVLIQKLHEKICEKHIYPIAGSNEKSFQKALEIVKKCTKINPIFLLYECDIYHCSLSRSQNPSYREMFENRVIQKICSSDKGFCHWVDFGSGALLQRLFIVREILIVRPKLSMRLDFTDKQYFALMMFLKSIQNTSEFYTTIPINESMIADAKNVELCREFIKKKYPSYDGYDLKYAVYWQYVLFSQFTSFLNKTFPYATVWYGIYDTAHSYLSSMNSSSKNVPDYVTAVDIADCDNGKQAASMPYIALCAMLLKKNPELCNFWLDKGPSKKEVFLKTIVPEGYQAVSSADNVSIEKVSYEYGKSEEGGLSGICYIKKEILNNDAKKL